MIALAAVLVVLVPLGAGSAVAADARQVSDGTFTWGVKQSFRSYVVGPIAKGKITTSKGASQAADNGELSFTKGTGQVRADDQGAVLSFEGTVHFTGHGGELNMTLADPTINVNATGAGYLEVEHTFGGRTSTVKMADVTGATLSVSGDKATLRGAKMKVSKAGEVVFDYNGNAMYPAGTELDTGSVTADLKKVDPTDPPTTDPTDPPTTDPTDPGVPDDPEPTAPKPTSPKPTNPKPTTPKPTKPGNGGSTTGRAGSLMWGVKSSFRSYIGGPIAQGRATTSGHARTSGGLYVFPQRSSSAKPPSPTGSTNYRGQVQFYGHHGELNMYLRNPRVVVTSATRGKLVVDSKPTGASGFRTVTVSNLNLSKRAKSTGKGSVTYRKVPVTLSSAGAKLFTWEGRSMYPSGTVMDPVSFTIGSDKKVSGSGKTTTTKPKGTPSSGGGGAGPNGWTGANGSNESGTAPGTSPSLASRATGAGSLTWGLRKSFRDYITGPIAHGSISVSGGASSSGNAFSFPQSGSAKGDGGADYRGAVNFRGHGGILNLSFADPAVSIDSGSKGTLTAKVGGRRISIASLNLGAGAKSESGGATSYANVPATLSAQGSSLFDYNGNSFYPAGTAMDPVSFTVGSAGSPASGSSSSAPETVATADTATSTGTPPALDPKTARIASAKASKDACVATGSNLVWGFKESFRSYVSGSIANGDWSTSGGATYTTPNFVWKKGEGTFDEKSTTGAVEFPGTISFSGHDGKLNTTVSDPEIRIEGDRAVVVLDTEGATMEAAMEGRDDTKAYPNVPFVEIDLSDATVETKGGKTTITASEAPTKLTSQGEAAFSSYTAGTEFDPISFTITAKSSCLAPEKLSKDAKSSDDPTAVAAPSDGGPLVGESGGIPMWAAWVGGGALGAGAAASITLLLARRRFTSGAAA